MFLAPLFVWRRLSTNDLPFRYTGRLFLTHIPWRFRASSSPCFFLAVFFPFGFHHRSGESAFIRFRPSTHFDAIDISDRAQHERLCSYSDRANEHGTIGLRPPRTESPGPSIPTAPRLLYKARYPQGLGACMVTPAERESSCRRLLVLTLNRHDRSNLSIMSGLPP